MKNITFTVTDDRGTTEISERFDEDASWMAVAYLFYKFLAAMGYSLDVEDVGADVDDYLASAPEEEGNW